MIDPMIEVIIIFGVSLLLLRDGLKNVKFKKGRRKRHILRDMISFQVAMGGLLAVISGYMFATLLEGLPLTKAFPMLSLVYVVLIPLEMLFLDEPLRKNEIAGIILILGGSALI
jgi:drug/metabolite transporter (DMT)-like permease